MWHLSLLPTLGMAAGDSISLCPRLKTNTFSAKPFQNIHDYPKVSTIAFFHTLYDFHHIPCSLQTIRSTFYLSRPPPSDRFHPSLFPPHSRRILSPWGSINIPLETPLWPAPYISHSTIPYPADKLSTFTSSFFTYNIDFFHNHIFSIPEDCKIACCSIFFHFL